MEDQMNYREMYYKMAKATEQAIRLLIRVQQECEELYLKSGEDASPTVPIDGGEHRDPPHLRSTP